MAAKNRKDTVLNSEPAWKKRRREGAKVEKKNKLWVGLVCAFGVLMLALMIYLIIRPGNRAHENNSSHYGRATVAAKQIETKDGKTHRYVTFKVGSAIIKWDTNQTNYDSLKNGQDVLLEYLADTYNGNPYKVRGWRPWVVEKAGEAATPKGK